MNQNLSYIRISISSSSSDHGVFGTCLKKPPPKGFGKPHLALNDIRLASRHGIFGVTKLVNSAYLSTDLPLFVGDNSSVENARRDEIHEYRRRRRRRFPTDRLVIGFLHLIGITNSRSSNRSTFTRDESVQGLDIEMLHYSWSWNIFRHEGSTCMIQSYHAHLCSDRS